MPLYGKITSANSLQGLGMETKKGITNLFDSESYIIDKKVKI